MGHEPRSDAPASSRRRSAAVAVAAGGFALALAGCGGVGYTSGQGADKARGKALFQQKCGACHTLADAGTAGTIGPNLDDAFRMDRVAGMTESTILQVVRGQIAYAISTTSTGSPGMPRNLVTGQDAVDVASYIAGVAGTAAAGAAAPAPAPTPAPAAPATTTAPSGGAAGGASATAVAAGKKVFLSAGCGACHTLKDAGSSGTVGPNLDQLKLSKDRIARQVTNGGAVMPAFKGRLSAQQIDAVATYVSSVAGK